LFRERSFGAGLFWGEIILGREYFDMCVMVEREDSGGLSAAEQGSDKEKNQR